MKCRYFCRLSLDISPVYLTRGISFCSFCLRKIRRLFAVVFKNAEAFLLRDARHAKHDIFLLRISAILPEAISDGGLTPTTDTNLLLAT